jgi:hypothetical protein
VTVPREHETSGRLQCSLCLIKFSNPRATDGESLHTHQYKYVRARSTHSLMWSRRTFFSENQQSPEADQPRSTPCLVFGARYVPLLLCLMVSCIAPECLHMTAATDEHRGCLYVTNRLDVSRQQHTTFHLRFPFRMGYKPTGK